MVQAEAEYEARSLQAAGRARQHSAASLQYLFNVLSNVATNITGGLNTD